MKETKKNGLSIREKLAVFFFRLLFILYCCAILSIGGAVIVMIALWFPIQSVKVIILAALAALILLVLTKKIRLRAKFGRKLKKLCAAKKYRVRYVRRLGKAFSWADGAADFFLDANGRQYAISMVTPKKKTVKVCFEEKNRLMMYIPTSFSPKIAEAFGVQDKQRQLSLEKTPTQEDVIKVLVVNPDRCEVLCKSRDGGLISAGNGATYFGYMVYMGEGFLKALENGDMVPQKKNFNKIDF